MAEVDTGALADALDPAGAELAAALEGGAKAAESDRSALTSVIGSLGGGVWKFIAQTAGLPGDMLSWANKKVYSLQGRDPASAPRPLLPTSAEIRDIGPTAYNAATSALGIDSTVVPFRPETPGQQALETIGENVGAGLTLGLGLAARGANLASRGLDPAARVVGGQLATTPIDTILSQTGSRLATAPVGLGLAEAGLGAGAGVGQVTAEKLTEDLPDDSLVKSLAPTVGNIIGGAGTGALGTATRYTGKKISGAVSPYIDENSNVVLQKMFGTENAQRIAAEILWKKQSTDVDTAVTNLENFVTNLGDGSVFSAAQMAQDGGLLTLERSIISSDAKRVGLNKQQEARFNDTAQGYLKRTAVDEANPGAQRPETATEWFSRVAEQSIDALDRRVTTAAREANDAIAKLGPRAPLTKISAEARAAVDTAYNDANLQQSALWAPLKANEDFRIEIGAPLRKELDAISAEMPKSAKPGDYPADIAKLMKGANEELIAEQQMLVNAADARVKASMKDGNFGAAQMQMVERAQEQTRLDFLKLRNAPALEEFETVREVFALRSRIGEASRQARSETNASGPNAALAHNLDRLYRSISDSIDKAAAEDGTGFGAQLAAANKYSKAFNDTFTRGPLAEVLGKNARGGQRQDPRELLRQMTGGDEPGVVDITALLDVEGFANAARQALIAKGHVPEGQLGTPIRQLTEGYLANRYLAEVATRGETGDYVIDPRAHERWTAKYKEQLDLFPNLKANIDSADSRSQMLANLTRDRDQQIKLESQTGTNALALWLDGDAETAMARVLRNRDRQGEMMRDLVKQAQRDPTGQALPAMRRMFYDEMMAHGRIQTTDAKGLRELTEVSLQKFLDRNRGAMKALYEPWQQKAIRDVVGEIKIAESTKNAKAFTNDSGTAMTEAALRELDQTALSTMIKGAFSIGRLGGAIRTIPFISGIANEADRQLSQKVMGIIGEALTSNDPALLKTLLLRPTPENVPTIRARLRPYLVVPGDDKVRGE